MDVSQFQKDKEIDPNQLDVECVRQSDRFFYWSELKVEAEYREDRAKLKVDVTRSRLEIECRKRPQNFGLDRPTDKAVEAAVNAHIDFQEAYRGWLEARRERKLLEAAVASMDSKRRMLDNLIRLHGQQYFAGPSVPHNLVATWKEYQEKSSADLVTRQKARLRTRKRGE